MIYVCFPSILLDTTHTLARTHSFIQSTPPQKTKRMHQIKGIFRYHQIKINWMDGYTSFYCFFFGCRTYTVREKGAHNFVFYFPIIILLFFLFFAHIIRTNTLTKFNLLEKDSRQNFSVFRLLARYRVPRQSKNESTESRRSILSCIDAD